MSATTAWRARFFEASELFVPIREVAARFANEATFPAPDRIELDSLPNDVATCRGLVAVQRQHL